jgi:hypothetical protein
LISPLSCLSSLLFPLSFDSFFSTLHSIDALCAHNQGCRSCVGAHHQRRWHSLFRHLLPDRVCGENWGCKARAMLFAATHSTHDIHLPTPGFCGGAESRRRVEILVQPAPSRAIGKFPATAASGTRKSNGIPGLMAGAVKPGTGLPCRV